MKAGDRQVLKEILKRSDIAIHTIYSIIDKVYDDKLAVDLNKQSMKLEQIRNKAKRKMEEDGIGLKRKFPIERTLAWTQVQRETILNTSTGHIAEIMIQTNTKGITDIMRVINRNGDVSKAAVEIADELMDFDRITIERLMEYL